jgi:predicted MFS family arabinose efflux permease
VIVHAVTGAADAAFTISLAGSLFLSVSVNAARPRILIYLLCTLAPFAVLLPILAPLTDRFPGGYRAVIVGTAAGRAAVCAVMAFHLTTLFFFPEAFAVLVLGKTYSIAKSALVPRLVANPESFVAANARMARLATIGGLLGGVVGAVVLREEGPAAVVIVAALAHAGAAVLATRIPRPAAPPPPNPVVEVAELSSGRLGLAAFATSTVRFSVGFVTFLLALSLKTASEPAWVYGLVLVAGVIGGFVGTLVGPLARRWVNEEALLTASLAVPGVICLLAAPQDRRTGAILVSFTIGVAAAVAHQAFDSTTQRLAPDAEKGRAFARFETRFQLAWVAGAVGPVLLQPSGFVGLVVIGVVLGLGAMAYLMARRVLRSEPTLSAASATGDPVEALIGLAHALNSQGEPSLAVLIAAEAMRVQDARRRPGNDHHLPAELAALWLHVIHGGVASDGDVNRAIRAAEQDRHDP